MVYFHPAYYSTEIFKTVPDLSTFYISTEGENQLISFYIYYFVALAYKFSVVLGYVSKLSLYVPVNGVLSAEL